MLDFIKSKNFFPTNTLLREFIDKPLTGKKYLQNVSEKALVSKYAKNRIQDGRR